MRAHLVLLLATTVSAAEYRSPAGNQAPNPRPGASSVLPGGRTLEPLGRQFASGPGPFGIAISPNGRLIATANSGPEEFSVSVLRRDDRGRYQVSHLVAPKENSDEARFNTWRGVHMGIAFANNDEIFVSEGDPGRVRRLHLRDRNRVSLLELNQGPVRDSFAGALAYDPARDLLFVVDQANFRVVIFDADQRRQVASVATGRLPFAIALSPDRKRMYVTNIGMFEYRRIPGANPRQPAETGLPFPAFGFPSPEAQRGAQRETAQGEVAVPPLGDPNAEVANSLCVIDIENPAEPKVVAFVPTGTPVGGEVFGGSSPSDVLATADRIYVANAHNDSITVIDSATLERVGDIPIRVPGLESLRGVLPIGLAYYAPYHWLLVAEAGINAVGVIDTRTLDAVGHLPTAWTPSRIAIEEDTVYVANAKGHGTGANANQMIRLRGEPFHRGAITVFPVPAAGDLEGLTQQVWQINGLAPAPAEPPAYPAEIRHVVLIVKKGRSFDEVFGDIVEARNGKVAGAQMMARFGRYGSASGAGGGFGRRFSLRGVNVTPNQHEMALRWAFSESFYSDSETATGGNHWLAGAPPNAWTLSSLMAAEGGMKTYRPASPAPGRLLFPDSAQSVHPEAIPELGDLWRHLERHGVAFRNFGGGLELAGAYRGERMEPTGVRFLTNVPMPESLFRVTSRGYPSNNTNIPDQERATRFIDEIEELYRKPGEELPRFLYVHLPNDGMANARPADGYPFPASFVADNDYALGRIVEYLSHTPWWANMAVFVTEDGAYGGVDHIDSHRTLLLAISPYARKNYVSRTNVSYPGLLKTIFGILGVPPLNLFDAAATDLSDCFTSEPGLAPFEVQPIHEELFAPDRARPR